MKKYEIVYIDASEKGKCELCGVVDEVRPYGPGGKFVCFDCMMKDEEEAKRQFEKLTTGKITIIDDR